MTEPCPAADPVTTASKGSRPAPIAGGTRRNRSRVAWITLIILAGLLLLVRTVQIQAGAPTAAFGAFPDEPAHFVGGLLFYDYLKSPSWKHPSDFVSNYHLFLPYFAVGVWPPFFYLIEAAWMEVFGTSRESVIWLIAIIAAALGALLSRILKKRFEIGTAVAGGAMFLLIPTVQWSECLVMADLICSLFALAAIVSFARFMDTGRWSDSALFGAFSGIALLTKNSTYFLALIPVFTILAARRWDLLRTRALWIGPGVVASLYLPWLVISRPFLLLGIHGLELPGFWGIQREYFVALWRETSLLLPLATGGAFLLIASRRPMRPIAMCMLAVIPAVSIGIFVAKVPVQDRLLIVPYAAIVFLACEFLGGLLPSGKRQIVMLACLLAFGALNWGKFTRPPVNQIRGAAAFIQARDHNRPGTVLVPTASEGPWIAEMAQSETKRPARIILRPTKAFGEEDWNGTNWHPNFTSADQLATFFQWVPVKYVILAPPSAARSYPHEALLESVVAGQPGAWRLAFVGGGGERVYENVRWTPESEPAVLNEVKRLSLSYLR